MARNYQLPEGKRLHMYRSGDSYFPGTTVVVNPLHVKSLDNLLTHVTAKVDAMWGAVRSIHTPNTGTVVESLDSLKRRGAYVAAGPQGFQPIRGGYESIGKPGFKRSKAFIKARPVLPKTETLTLQVYRNGDEDFLPVPFRITKKDFGQWDQALFRLSEKVRLSTGPVKRIYDMKGKILRSPSDIVSNQSYVAAGSNESFRDVEYPNANSHEAAIIVKNKGTELAFQKRREAKARQVQKGEELPRGRGGGVEGTTRKARNVRRAAVQQEGSQKHEENKPQRKVVSKKKRSPTVKASRLKSSRPSTQQLSQRAPPTPTATLIRGKTTTLASHRMAIDTRPSEVDTTRRGTRKLSRSNPGAPEVVSRSNSRATNRGNKKAASRVNSRVNSTVNSRAPSRVNSRANSRVNSRASSPQGKGDRDFYSYSFEEIREMAPPSATFSLDQLSLKSGANHSFLPSPVHSRSGSPTAHSSYIRSRAGSVYSYHEPIAEEREAEERALEESSQRARQQQQNNQKETGEVSRPETRASLVDSGHASLLSDFEDRPDSVFRAKRKSRPPTRAVEVDYDTDDGGVYRARAKSEYAKNAAPVEDSTETKIELPIDLVEAREVQEEVYSGLNSAPVAT